MDAYYVLSAVLQLVKQLHSYVLMMDCHVQMIKDQMDKKFGSPWHVIVGRGFAYEITYEVGIMANEHLLQGSSLDWCVKRWHCCRQQRAAHVASSGFHQTCLGFHAQHVYPITATCLCSLLPGKQHTGVPRAAQQTDITCVLCTHLCLWLLLSCSCEISYTCMLGAQLECCSGRCRQLGHLTLRL